MPTDNLTNNLRDTVEENVKQVNDSISAFSSSNWAEGFASIVGNSAQVTGQDALSILNNGFGIDDRSRDRPDNAPASTDDGSGSRRTAGQAGTNANKE